MNEVRMWSEIDQGTSEAVLYMPTTITITHLVILQELLYEPSCRGATSADGSRLWSFVPVKTLCLNVIAAVV